MDIFQPNRKPKNRARERIEARQNRRAPTAMATPRTTTKEDIEQEITSQENPSTRNAKVLTPDVRAPRTTRRGLERRDVTSALSQVGDSIPRPSFRLPNSMPRLRGFVADAFWYLRHDRRVGLGLIGVVLAIFGIFVAVHALNQRIYPNIWVLGRNIGGLSADEATQALQSEWMQNIRIELVDGSRTWVTTPTELGLRLDAVATVESAQAAGMGGIPFGYEIEPILTVDTLRAQNTLLDFEATVRIQPYNAGFRWVDDQVVGVSGSPGRFLDVAQTMEFLDTNMISVVKTRQLPLIMTIVEPATSDPQAYLAQVQSYTSVPFRLIAFDPIRDERLSWATDRDLVTSWIEVGEDGLTLRETAFAEFLSQQISSLAATDPLRYLEPTDTMQRMRTAINAGQTAVDLRIRYRNDTYTVQGGDTGYRIARRTGIPFFLLQQANPGFDWEALMYPGQQINLPPRDVTMPITPVSNKRIIIDIPSQTLWAYENNQLVFSWTISTGMDRAPTSPGIFQVLSHAETATGSSVELCGDNSCGAWTMNWFMGIYEVSPGLVNGFHGNVLLPGGGLLGDGNVGYPNTFGCIMSDDGNAQALYLWAEDGTIVEIIGSDFDPVSQLAQQSIQQVRENQIQMAFFGGLSS